MSSLNLIKILELDKFKEVYNQDWLFDKRNKLNILLEEKNRRIQDLKNKSHELELDLSLNEEDYWIANNDQQRLYKLISGLDIQVYYGSDFLINSLDKKGDFLEKFPLLPYGLVLMYEADWEKVERNLSEEDLFRAAVPVFINHQLEDIDVEDSFKLASGKEKDFLFFPERYQEWSESLASQQREITETITAVDKKIENIRRLDYSAELLLKEKPSKELSIKLSKLKDEKEKQELEIENRQKKLLSLEEEIVQLAKKMLSSEDRKGLLELDYQDIEEFAEETSRLEEKKSEIASLKERLIELEENLSQNSTARYENIKLQLKIDSDQKSWLKDTRRFLAEIKEIAANIQFEEENIEKELQNYPVLYDYRDSQVNKYYQNLIDLEREEEAKSAEIKHLREKQNSIREMILKNEMIKNKILKIKIKEKIIQDFRIDKYDFNYDMLSSFREYLHNELNRLDDNKTEAERARNQWAERSSMHVIRMITSLKEMINNMVFHNQKAYAFPLVRMRRSDFLPELEDEIIPELKEYFLELIDKFNREDINIDRLAESEIMKYTGDAALFSRAIRGRYPILQVYKMTEKNEFQCAKPEDYFYADWEAVIQGKGDTPEGSGGQSLSINAFMMMMLLNYKKQGLDKTNPWTVLFLDNPFGKASAAHVLDPIFEIANKLNFQIIAFAAPEIIKTEISERFPVFYPLEISNDEKGHGLVKVSGKVIYGERIRRR